MGAKGCLYRGDARGGLWFFGFFNIYLFIWLHRVLVAACGIFRCRAGSLVVARALERTGLVARGVWDLSSPTRDQTRVPCSGRPILNHWTSREVPPGGF